MTSVVKEYLGVHARGKYVALAYMYLAEHFDIMQSVFLCLISLNITFRCAVVVKRSGQHGATEMQTPEFP